MSVLVALAGWALAVAAVAGVLVGWLVVRAYLRAAKGLLP